MDPSHRLCLSICETCTLRNRPLAPWLLLLVTVVLEFSAQSKTVQAVLIVHLVVDFMWLLAVFVQRKDQTDWVWGFEAAICFIGIKLMPAMVAWYVHEPTLLCKIALVASNWYYLPMIVLGLMRAFIYNDILPMDVNWGLFTYRRHVAFEFRTAQGVPLWGAIPQVFRTTPTAA